MNGYKMWVVRFGQIFASLVVLASASQTFGQGCCGSGGRNHGNAAQSHDEHTPPQCHEPNAGLPQLVARTPHGGFYLNAAPFQLEVVYLPREARVYLYGSKWEPLSTLKLKAQMLPRTDNSRPPLAILLQLAVQRTPQDQDYLVAPIEAWQLADETPVTFRFENLPDNKHSKAEFTPVFHRSDIRPYIARVSFVQADRDRLAKQQVCPVTGARLGSMGMPIKVLVGDDPLYLCCEACIERVKDNGAPANSLPR